MPDEDEMGRLPLILAAIAFGLCASTPAKSESQSDASIVRALRVGLAGPPHRATEFEHEDVISMRAFSKGRIVVVDARWPRIMMIDSSGRILAALDQVGDGPSDVRMPYRVALNPERGLVAVYDGVLRRISVFDEALKLKASLSATRSLPLIGSLAFDESGASLFLATATTTQRLKGYSVHRLEIESDSVTGELPRDSTASLGAAIRFGVGVVANAGRDHVLFVQKYPLALRRLHVATRRQEQGVMVPIDDLTPPDSAFVLDMGDNGGPRIRARSDVRTMTAAFPVSSELTVLTIVGPGSLEYVLAARDGRIVGSVRGTRGSTAIVDVERADRRIWFAKRDDDRGVIRLWYVRY